MSRLLFYEWYKFLGDACGDVYWNCMIFITRYFDRYKKLIRHLTHWGQNKTVDISCHFVNALSHWETTLHCNAVSHWLDACTQRPYAWVLDGLFDCTPTMVYVIPWYRQVLGIDDLTHGPLGYLNEILHKQFASYRYWLKVVVALLKLRPVHFRWTYMMTCHRWFRWWQVNVSLGIDLVPSCNKPLFEP